MACSVQLLELEPIIDAKLQATLITTQIAISLFTAFRTNKFDEMQLFLVTEVGFETHKNDEISVPIRQRRSLQSADLEMFLNETHIWNLVIF